MTTVVCELSHLDISGVDVAVRSEPGVVMLVLMFVPVCERRGEASVRQPEQRRQHALIAAPS